MHAPREGGRGQEGEEGGTPSHKNSTGPMSFPDGGKGVPHLHPIIHPLVPCGGRGTPPARSEQGGRG